MNMYERIAAAERNGFKQGESAKEGEPAKEGQSAKEGDSARPRESIPHVEATSLNGQVNGVVAKHE